MRSIIMRGAVPAVAALLAACSSDAPVSPTTTSPAARRSVAANESVAAVSRLIDQYVWMSCANGGAGETIRVTGELRYDVQSTKDSAGVYHFSIKSNTTGLTGVGLTTGTFFRGLMTERVNSRAEDYLNEDLRTADIIKFVAPGSGEAYSLMVSSHIIIDDGDYVLWEDTWSEVCR